MCHVRDFSTLTKNVMLVEHGGVQRPCAGQSEHVCGHDVRVALPPLLRVREVGGLLVLHGQVPGVEPEGPDHALVHGHPQSVQLEEAQGPAQVALPARRLQVHDAHEDGLHGHALERRQQPRDVVQETADLNEHSWNLVQLT